MTGDEKYMKRCLEIAIMGLGNTAQNPLVGSVIVYKDKIIGEGFHQKYGEAHAEVNAIHSVNSKQTLFLPDSSLYVNLEPCSHYGKTPPCTDFILKNNIRKIIIGCKDSNEKVSGKGIEKLRKNGCEVTIGVLENECRIINKRFFTFHEKKRPYIILKWAQTTNGYIAHQKSIKKVQISNLKSQILLHKWRSEEQAIMVGTNTALTDNPQLNIRKWYGNSPVRIVIDKNLRLPSYLNLFDKSQPTIIFTDNSNHPQLSKNLEYQLIDFNKNIIPQILFDLFQRQIQSVIVEGGSQLLNSFINHGIWDEARVFIAPGTFDNGIKAPLISGILISKDQIGVDELAVYLNKT